MTDRSESHAAQRLAEETGEPRERFTAGDKPLPELDELEPVTDGGVDQGESEVEQFDPADYDNVRDALREAPAGYGVESVIDYFDPVVDGGHEVDVDV